MAEDENDLEFGENYLACWEEESSMIQRLTPRLCVYCRIREALERVSKVFSKKRLTEIPY